MPGEHRTGRILAGRHRARCSSFNDVTAENSTAAAGGRPLLAPAGALRSALAALGGRKEVGQCGNDSCDAGAESQQIALAIPGDDMAEEQDREHNDDDADQFQLEVVEGADLQPLRQLEIRVDEEFVEAEGDHQQHGPEYEQIDYLDKLECDCL